MPKGIYPRKPRPFKDLTGKQFGKWSVIELGERKNGSLAWRCVCACGAEQIVRYSHLVGGNSTACVSCGKYRGPDHHMWKGYPQSHPLYACWNSMKRRCENPTNESYRWYGARGIKVCERWKNDFWTFVADMGRKPSTSHSIDRIDGEKDYSPDNCRWASASEQALNTRRNHLLSYEGKLLPLTTVARLRGIDPQLLRDRVRLGWKLEDALNRPKRKSVHK